MYVYMYTIYIFILLESKEPASMMLHRSILYLRSLKHVSSGMGLARRCYGSATEISQALRSGDFHAVLSNPQTDARAFADTIWKMVYDQQHQRVTTIYEALPKQSTLRNEDVLLAAMSSYGSQRRFQHVLDLFSKIANRKLTERTLFVLIHAATMSDHLKTAEELLFHWLDRVAKQQPAASLPAAPLPPDSNNGDSNSGDTVKTFAPMLNLRSLFKQWKVVPQYNVGREVSELLVDKPLLQAAKLDWSQVGRSPVPLHAWATIIRAYCHAGKWRRCWFLLELLEKEQQASGLYTIASSHADEAASPLKLDVLLSRHHFLEPYSPDLLWSLIYHRTLQVMCERYDYPMAALVCDKMQRAKVAPEIVAAIHLMKSYHRGSAVLSKDIIQSDFEESRKEILSLGDQVLENVWALLGRVETDGDGFHTAKTLAKEYVTSLCKLELPEVAEEFLEVLGKKELSSRLLRRPELFAPLVHRYSREGDWANAKRVFELIADRHREVPTMYHNVCSAMQKAGKLEEMTDFILQYGQAE